MVGAQTIVLITVLTLSFLTLPVEETLSSEEPKPRIIHSIEFNGSVSLDRLEVLSSIYNMEGGLLLEGELGNDVKRIRAKYFDKGYPMADVTAPTIKTIDNGQSVIVVFPITEREQFTVSEVNYRKNTVFTDNELRAQALIKSPDIFQREKLRQEIQRVLQLYSDKSYLQAAVVPAVMQDSGTKTARIDLYIREGQREEQAGILGSSARSLLSQAERRDDKGDFVGAIYLYQQALALLEDQQPSPELLLGTLGHLLIDYIRTGDDRKENLRDELLTGSERFRDTSAEREPQPWRDTLMRLDEAQDHSSLIRHHAAIVATTDSLAAERMYEQALRIAQAEGLPRDALLTLLMLGTHHLDVHRSAPVLQRSEVIERLAEQAPGLRSQANHILGEAHFQEGNIQQALTHAKQSLEFLSAIQDVQDKVTFEFLSTWLIARSYLRVPQFDEALAAFEQVLRLSLTDSSIPVPATDIVRSLMEPVTDAQWRFTKPTEIRPLLAYLEGVGNLLKQSHLTEQQTTVQTIAGSWHANLGDVDDAIALLSDAYRSSKENGFPVLQGRVLLRLASVYLEAGDPDRALAAVKEARTLCVDDTNLSLCEASPIEIELLIGRIHRALENHDIGLSHFQKAWSLFQQRGLAAYLSEPGPEEFNETLKQMIAVELGDAYFLTGRLSEAETWYELVHDEGRLGFIALSKKNYAQARQRFTSYGMAALLATQLLRARRVPLDGHLGLALALEGLGDYTAARDAFFDLVQLLERERANVENQGRLTFLQRKILNWHLTEIYEGLVRSLFALTSKDDKENIPQEPWRTYGRTYEEVAFYFSEYGKSRVLLEQLAAKRRTGQFARVPPDVRKEDLRRQILIKALSQLSPTNSQSGTSLRLLLGQSLSGWTTSLGLPSLFPYQKASELSPNDPSDNIERLRREQQQFVQQLRTDYPEYAFLRYPEPVPIEKLSLVTNEVLFCYEVMEHSTLLWVVKQGHLVKTVVIQHGREELKNLIMEWRGNYSPREWRPTASPAVSNVLFKILLQEGLSAVEPQARLIIVPDEFLSLLPFEALRVDPGTNSDFVGELYTIHYSTSAAIVAFDRAVPQNTPANRKDLFAIADPIFDSLDSRYPPVASEQSSEDKPRKNVEVVGENPGSFIRLVGSQTEVNAIAKVLGVRTPSVDVLTGADAVKHRVLHWPLNIYKYIHLSTHGILAGDVPGVDEPALVLSRLSRDRQDWLMTVGDILGLNLNADIVVLSACETAIGKHIAGEGLMALSRAFLYAGASAVVVSLWRVSEASTTELMKAFYAYLKAGLAPAEAMRKAKHDLIALGKLAKRSNPTSPESAWDSPRFWSPFIVIGN